MPVLNKPALIDQLATATDTTKATAARFLEAFQDIVVESVAKGEDVKLTGFAAFERSTRSAREMVNPRTGEKIQVSEAQVVKIRPLKRFRDEVAGSAK